MTRELLLIDGNSIATASYFALKGADLRAQDGTPTGAVKGFIMTFFSLMDNFPDHIGVVFDKRAKLLRKDIDPNYKANRNPIDEELAVQYPLIQEFLKCMNVPMFADDGYEADDIIYSFADKFHTQIPIRIATRDKDLLQICAMPNVTVHLLRPGGRFISYTNENAYQVFNVPADRIATFKALAGDPSDNIGGVPGIGEKTAAEIINTYGSYENIRGNAQAGTMPTKYLRRLASHLDEFDMAYQLASFMHREIKLELAALERRAADERALQAFYNKLNINI